MNDRTPAGSAPGRPLLPALFADQAAATPKAPAVLAADGTVLARYAELAERVGVLASRLRAAGVRPGTVVGVCLRRGRDLPAGLLAVWLAGGTYVPLDPDHPESRLALVLADAGAELVLAERATEDRLPRGAAGLLLTDDTGAVDREGAELPAEPVEFVPDPDRPAYVLHTSGSTGRPKGVVVPHGGIANRVRWLTHRHKLGPADRMLLKTTVGFDAAGLELFAPLISGGAVVLAPDGAQRDPAALLRAVGTGGVTVLQGVPSVYRQLLAEDGWQHCTALRLLFSAGEPLHAELCRELTDRLRPVAPEVQIWNTYGPTEASIDITERRWEPTQTTGPVPIGKPIGNMRVLVLDPTARPVPVGVPGELHAGGVGLALGYLDRPDQTAAAFVPDPYGGPGSRLYRTGDRVRWTADGELEYLGRIDQQVKVNGVRIEPGEVEAALAAQPLVRAAVVATRPDGAGGHRLVAWVQSRGERLRPDALRTALRATLPDPLVPTVFVPVEEFALNASGKIDRGALPDPATAAEETELVPLAGCAELAVAGEWARLLDLDPGAIGATHDFFQLGGSSLMLTRLAEGLSAATGARVELRRLFTATTVRAQAALLAEEEPEEGPDEPEFGTAAGTAASAARDAEVVRPVAREADGLPLSPGQQGLWLLDRLRPGSSEWNAPVFVTLPAEHTDDTVRRALAALADRHEILRTRYALRGDEPVQFADPPGGRAPAVRFATAGSAAEQRALVVEEFAAGFDLAEGPVWRALVVRGADALTVVLSIHHIACDGWSSVVVERDLTALADALHRGVAAGLPELPVQYADHAVHRRQALESARAREELAYWTEQLAGIAPVELPADRPRPALRDASGAAELFTVPAPLAERLGALGRRQGATLQQTLLTAFGALVARLTGRWDIPVGVPVAGRERPEVAEVVGFFLNTLVLRCDTPGTASFEEAVARTRDTARAAFAHGELPFDRLVDALDPDRDPSRTPLYQVMFDLHEEGRTGTATGAGDLDAFREAWCNARTDLTLVVQRQPDGSLLGMVEYATALFDRDTVTRFADNWVRLLESVAADPGQPLAEAEVLPARALAELLARGAGERAPGTAPEPDGSVREAIARSVRATPDAVAVVHAGRTLSYAELDARAAEFAAALAGAGIGPEDTVAVLLGRTPDLLAAFLGAWQAGAGYVPLDPAAPDERLGYVLADAGARVLVTDAAGAARLADHFTGTVLDAAALPLPAPGSAPPAPPADPAALAYVLYTSGSTGRPKGVDVEHRSLLRMLHASRDHLDFGRGPDDAWLALAQPTFDISCTELFMPLVAGGRVVLGAESELSDHHAQLRLIEEHRVSHLQVAPPHWQMLIDAGLGDVRQGGRPLVGQTGGEPCPPALARELAGRLTRFVNEYGLTETTIAATRWEASATPGGAGESAEATAVPVGRGYPHVTARVLDARLRPVPYGTVGELCIGGTGLARGYHGRPDLTAAGFVPDPYGPPGARLYRSGDLARMRPDGTVEFAGRADGQAKIRGRRVETGEVQAVLAEHPAVGQAVVTVHGTGPEAALIGYWVTAPEAEQPAESALLDHCASRLPDYMLPSLLILIPAVPLTRHNKVDTAKLPVPDLAAALSAEPYTPPEGPVQEAVAAIWAEVLHGTAPEAADTPAADAAATAAPRIGARQGFFRIGGNSVRAAKVVARIQEEFDIELPLRVVFEHPTVAGLADAVEAAVTAEIEALTESELADAYRELQP